MPPRRIHRAPASTAAEPHAAAPLNRRVPAPTAVEPHAAAPLHQQESQQHRPRVYVVTVATDASLLGLYRTTQGLHGLPEPVVLGLDGEWQGPRLDDGFKGGFKHVLLRKWLRETRPRGGDVVVFTDAYDVFWNAPLGDLDALLDGIDILFAAEPTCWPDPALASQYPDADSPYQFLNSGCFVGRARAVAQLCARTSATDDDQLVCTMAFLRDQQRGTNRLRIDSRCRLWQCLGGVGTLDKGELEWRAQADGGASICNTRFDSIPVAIHGNGNSEMQAIWRKLAEVAIQSRQGGE